MKFADVLICGDLAVVLRLMLTNTTPKHRVIQVRQIGVAAHPPHGFVRVEKYCSEDGCTMECDTGIDAMVDALTAPHLKRQEERVDAFCRRIRQEYGVG